MVKDRNGRIFGYEIGREKSTCDGGEGEGISEVRKVVTEVLGRNFSSSLEQSQKLKNHASTANICRKFSRATSCQLRPHN